MKRKPSISVGRSTKIRFDANFVSHKREMIFFLQKLFGRAQLRIYACVRSHYRLLALLDCCALCVFYARMHSDLLTPLGYFIALESQFWQHLPQFGLRSRLVGQSVTNGAHKKSLWRGGATSFLIDESRSTSKKVFFFLSSPREKEILTFTTVFSALDDKRKRQKFLL